MHILSILKLKNKYLIYRVFPCLLFSANLWAVNDSSLDDTADLISSLSAAEQACNITESRHSSLPVANDCFVSLSTIREHVSDYLIIDTSQDYQGNAGYIPNALRIPLSHLANKPFLKQRPVLVLTPGIQRYAAQQFCKNAAIQGVEQLYFLRGGINNWRYGGMPYKTLKDTSVIGFEVTGQDFWLEYHSGNLTSITLDQQVSQTLDKQFGMSVQLWTLNDSSSLKQRLSTLLTSMTDSKPIVILGGTSDQLKQKLQKWNLPNVYLLSNAEQKLMKFSQQIQWTNSNRNGVSQRDRCNNA